MMETVREAAWGALLLGLAIAGFCMYAGAYGGWT